MPKISIIVPNYNTEKYLPRCLNSLIAQTFKDIEIILIDDGSTDKSVQIMEDFAKRDRRIKIMKQKNSGPAVARNKGLEAATGKYLMFCDSDDWYEPDMCKVMYNTIEEQQVDVVCCHTFFEFEEKFDINEKKERAIEQYYNPKKTGCEKLNAKVICSTNVLIWNKIWRRDLIKKYHIYFPIGHEHEDDAFWYIYSMISSFIYHINNKLYHYFLRDGSIMSKQFKGCPKNKYDRLSISAYVFDFIKKHKLQKRYSDLIQKIYAQQFSCSSSFFSDIELLRISKNIIHKFEIENLEKRLAIINNKMYYIKKEKYSILLTKKYLYNILRFFWSFFNQVKSNKYKLRLKINSHSLELLKGTIK